MKSIYKLLVGFGAIALITNACAKHQFTEVANKPLDEVVQDAPPEEPTQPEEPTPEEPVPAKAPSIVWVQIPAPSSSTMEPVTAIYDIIPGSSPIVSVVCKYDNKPIKCSVDGDTLVFTEIVAAEHELQVVVTDANDLKDDETISWELFDKFQKVKQPLKVADDDAQVDVLFVVDNSASMKEEQANMAERIHTFMDRVKGFDWRIAVVTTDAVNATWGDGRFLKFPNNSYYITSQLDAVTAKDQFGKTVQRQENGDSKEQGIRGTYRAIERALNPKETVDQQHKNFFRAKAALNVVVLTDEDESASTAKNLGPNLVKLVQNTWGTDKIFKFHSIIVDPNDKVCDAKPDHVAGVAYANLTKLTSGILGNICEKDYGTQLSVIGQNIANTQNTFDLKCVPRDLNNDGTPDVIVTGLQVPNYQIVGSKIVFATPPKSGSYSIDYFCPKK